MHKFLISLLFLLVATALMAQKAQTVDYVLNQAQDGERVKLTGTFIADLDDDEYIFTDNGTSEIKVELNDRVENELRYQYNNLRLSNSGQTFEISAVVDKDSRWKRPELEVYSIVPTGGGAPAAAPAKR